MPLAKQFYSIPDFIKEHLRVGQHWNKKLISMKDAKWQELVSDTYLDNCTYAKGSKFKVFETNNFGWIVFHKDTLTPEGNIPNRRILKW